MQQLTAQQSRGDQRKGQPGGVVLVGEQDRQPAGQRSQNGNCLPVLLFINDGN